MQKNKKSKKARIEKLRELLDKNNGKEDLHPKDEIYLKSLSKRLKESSYEPAYHKKDISKDNGGTEEDSLKPKVKIYPRVEKKVIEFSEIEKQKPDGKLEKTSEVEFLPVEERKEISLEDEDIFEIEKAKFVEPEFVEVKPKKEIKKDVEFDQKKVIPEKEVMEWEPIDIKKEESEKVKPKSTGKFCENCGAKILKEAIFCEKCGYKIEGEQIEKKQKEPEDPEENNPQTFIPIEPKKENQQENKIKEQEWEPVDINDTNIKDEQSIKEEPVTFEEVKEEIKPEKLEEEFEVKKKTIEIKEEVPEEFIEEKLISFEEKITPFKEIKCIDNQTAILLYDNGFTNIDLLKNATYKDLKKIKGIKRKKAKEIIEELENENQEIDFELIIEEEMKDEIQPAEEQELIEPVKEEIKQSDRFCENCGAKILKEVIFCEKCGYKIEGEQIEKKQKEPEEPEENNPQTFIPIEPKKENQQENKIKEQEWEHSDIQEKQTDEIQPIIEPETKQELPEPEEEQIPIEEKTKPFEEIKTIDQQTAITLYDNGITTIDQLKETNIKELKKIKGINKKKAKEIKEELQPKEEWMPIAIEDPEEEEDIEIQEEIEKIEVEEELVNEETKFENEEKIRAFKDIESIDKETAIILYDNYFTNIDSLKDMSSKELSKKVGIKRRLAKKIINEIREKTDEKVDEDFQVFEKDVDLESTDEKEIKEELPEPEEEQIPIEEKTKPFEEIKTIDQQTAITLYDNGITTIDQLKETNIKELKKIKGINKKKAKEIKEELQPKEEWEPITTNNNFEDLNGNNKEIIENVEDKLELPEPGKRKEPVVEEKDKAFLEVNSIDVNISKLLKENGINSIEDIKKTTIKDLCSIKGIKRKIAKEIKKEVKEIINKKVSEIVSKNSFNREENPFIEEDNDDWDDWEYFDEEKISRQEKKDLRGFIYEDYTLFKKIIDTKNGVKRTIRFFSKAEPEKAERIDLPKGYEVKVNKKTGVPFLRKKN